MKKTVLLNVGVPILIVVVVSVAYWKLRERCAQNEGHSRYLRRNRVHEIHICLLFYVDTHDGRTPKDLYELVSQGYLRRSNLICPAKYRSVDRAGLLADDCPVFVSSYRLLTGDKLLAEIPDGTIVLREFEGNHPQSVVRGHTYSAGYHVILKDHNDLRPDFIYSLGAARPEK